MAARPPEGDPPGGRSAGPKVSASPSPSLAGTPGTPERRRRPDREPVGQHREVSVARDEHGPFSRREGEQVVVRRVEGADGWLPIRIRGNERRATEPGHERVRIRGRDGALELR